MTFERAMDFVDGWEGGWADHPADPGGLTRWGITIRTIIAHALDFNRDGRVDARDLAAMTKEEARGVYRRLYWTAMRCDDLPAPLAFLVFDCAVNQGQGRAGRFLQQAVGAKVDGKVGPATVAAAARAYLRDPRGVLREFATMRVLHYSSLSHFVTFGRGWTRRLIDAAMTAQAWVLEAERAA